MNQKIYVKMNANKNDDIQTLRTRNKYLTDKMETLENENAILGRKVIVLEELIRTYKVKFNKLQNR